MSDPLDSPGDPDAQRRRIRRSRNLVVALLLAGFVVLVYFISIAKMS
jgi:hypothetical protein